MPIVGYVAVGIAFLYSVIIHEISHGLVAESMGDPTARQAGRITLNPIPHLDLFGSILLPGMCILLGLPFAFGYAKPVPYNPMNLSDRVHGQAKVALAGPFSNLLLALMFGMALRFLPYGFGGELFTAILASIVYINLGLLIFNLVPLQPLDGHWILRTLLPDRFREVGYFMARYGIFIFIFFIFYAGRILTPLIQFLFRVIVGQ